MLRVEEDGREKGVKLAKLRSQLQLKNRQLADARREVEELQGRLARAGAVRGRGRGRGPATGRTLTQPAHAHEDEHEQHYNQQDADADVTLGTLEALRAENALLGSIVTKCKQARDVFRDEVVQAKRELEETRQALESARRDADAHEARIEEMKALVVDLDAQLRRAQEQLLQARADTDSSVADLVHRWRGEVQESKKVHARDVAHLEAVVQTLQAQRERGRAKTQDERVHRLEHEELLNKLSIVQLDRNQIQRAYDKLLEKEQLLLAEKRELMRDKLRHAEQLRSMQEELERLRVGAGSLQSSFLASPARGASLSSERRRSESGRAANDDGSDGCSGASYVHAGFEEEDLREKSHVRAHARSKACYLRSLDADRRSHAVHQFTRLGAGTPRRDSRALSGDDSLLSSEGPRGGLDAALEMQSVIHSVMHEIQKEKDEEQGARGGHRQRPRQHPRQRQRPRPLHHQHQQESRQRSGNGNGSSSPSDIRSRATPSFGGGKWMDDDGGRVQSSMSSSLFAPRAASSPRSPSPPQSPLRMHLFPDTGPSRDRELEDEVLLSGTRKEDRRAADAGEDKLEQRAQEEAARIVAVKADLEAQRKANEELRLELGRAQRSEDMTRRNYVALMQKHVDATVQKEMR